MTHGLTRLCCRSFVSVPHPIFCAALRRFGSHGIGKRFRIGSAADIATRPGEVVGTPARRNDGLAAIEHASGERVGSPFSGMTCGALPSMWFVSTQPPYGTSM